MKKYMVRAYPPFRTLSFDPWRERNSASVILGYYNFIFIAWMVARYFCWRNELAEARVLKND
jgi:hypothetical protein